MFLGSKMAEGQSWTAGDGSALTYTNFASGPVTLQTDSCLAMIQDGTWKVTNCDSEHFWTCEKPVKGQYTELNLYNKGINNSKSLGEACN